jgi:uncharacterized MnhB-related membrane protein
MVSFLLVIVAVVFAILAIRAKRLISSALWLAGVSALISVVFYLFGAVQVAVIELSVGAGLVTVLFAFAISVAGDEGVGTQSIVPQPLSIGLALLVVFLLGWYVLQLAVPAVVVSNVANNSLSSVLWDARGLDMLVQVVLIFSCVLGLLGLLAEVKAPLEGSVAEEVVKQRNQELQVLEGQFQVVQEEQK